MAHLTSFISRAVLSVPHPFSSTPEIIYTYPKPLLPPFLFDRQQDHTNISISDILDPLPSCICKATLILHPEASHPTFNSHVMTTVPSHVTNDPNLIHLLSQGTKFRPSSSLTLHQCINMISKCLDTFQQAYPECSNTTDQEFQLWKSSVLNNIRASTRLISPPKNASKHPSVSKVYAKHLSSLCKSFFLAVTDKLASAIVFMCPILAVSLTLQALHNDKSFIRIFASSPQVIHDMESSLEHHGISPATLLYQNLAQSVPFIKLHKHPPKIRSVSTAHAKAHFDLDQNLCSALQFLSHELLHFYITTGQFPFNPFYTTNADLRAFMPKYTTTIHTLDVSELMTRCAMLTF